MQSLKSKIGGGFVCALIIATLTYAINWQSGQAQIDLLNKIKAADSQASVNNLSTTTALERETVYQIAPLKALLEGVLEGDTPLSEVVKHGDFGIGAVNPLDGEVLMFGGKMWKATIDGKAKRLTPADKTPFVTVTFFDADKKITAREINGFADLGKQIDRQLNSLNLIYAIRITGEFEYLKARSVPPQKRPFPRLTEVLKQQVIFEHKKARGTIVGFRFPSFMNGLDAPGYHFHFITADESQGGHILDIRAREVAIEVDTKASFTIVLPHTTDFLKADLERQEANELQNLVQPKTPEK